MEKPASRESIRSFRLFVTEAARIGLFETSRAAAVLRTPPDKLASTVGAFAAFVQSCEIDTGITKQEVTPEFIPTGYGATGPSQEVLQQMRALGCEVDRKDYPEVPAARRYYSGLLGIDEGPWEKLRLNQLQLNAFTEQIVTDYVSLSMKAGRGREDHIDALRLAIRGVEDWNIAKRIPALSSANARVSRSRIKDTLLQRYENGVHTARQQFVEVLKPEQAELLKSEYPESFTAENGAK